METATPFPLLVIAVVDDNPADVYTIARVLHAHGLPYLLQVLESRQRALHFFDQLAGEDMRCPDLLLLDYTLPGLDTRELLQWIRALPACRATDIGTPFTGWTIRRPGTFSLSQLRQIAEMAVVVAGSAAR